MNKLITGLTAIIIALICVAAYAGQNTSIDIVEVRDPRRLRDWLEANAADADTRIPAAKVDTNATTTITAYKPDAVGQVLIGGKGTGTNGVWISKGTTTNDWVQVAP